MLWVGLLISLVAHVLAVGFAGAWLEPDREQPRRAPEPILAEPPRGMRAVQLSEAPPETLVPEEPDEPDEREPRPAPEAPPAMAATLDSLPADTLTAGDRLAVRVVDPRLWRPMILLPREPTIEDVEARVGAALELLSDSALAEAEAALRARDWTVKDANGGRWGISPGKLHLGKLTLPLPLFFGSVDPDAEAASQQWYELDQQYDRARFLESFEDRVRAIRERRDRERAERRNAENGGG